MKGSEGVFDRDCDYKSGFFLSIGLRGLSELKSFAQCIRARCYLRLISGASFIVTNSRTRAMDGLLFSFLCSQDRCGYAFDYSSTKPLRMVSPRVHDCMLWNELRSIIAVQNSGGLFQHACHALDGASSQLPL